MPGYIVQVVGTIQAKNHMADTTPLQLRKLSLGISKKLTRRFEFCLLEPPAIGVK